MKKKERKLGINPKYFQLSKQDPHLHAQRGIPFVPNTVKHFYLSLALSEPIRLSYNRII